MAFLLPVLVATLAAASPLTQFVPQHSLPSVPAGWTHHAAAPADHTIALQIRLKEENLDQLQQRLLQISDPDHIDYGKHMSKAEVDALTAPTKANVDAVQQWLASHGINSGDVKSGYLKVKVNVDQAKKLFNADYAVYKEASSGRQVVRTTSYSLPQNIHKAITMVQPTTMFSDMGISSKAKQSNPSGNKLAAQPAAASITSCNNGVDTQCLRDDYNIKGYTPTNKTTLGIAGFLGEVPSISDLHTYIADHDPDLPSNIPLPIKSINGGSTSAGGQGEADLDVQITVALTYPINNLYTSTGGSPPHNAGGDENEPYQEWLSYVIGLDSPPQTFSISYGDDEPTVPTDYADSVCTQFMKLGARGVSVLVAAGDSGAGGSSCTKFAPSFPAACPWVTVVGGTNTAGTSEQADAEGGSGFSNHFAQPAYQADAVNAYVKGLNGQFDGSYNKTGRAYPDVSALYRYYPVYRGGSEDSFRGTSASTPATASVIAILNDYLIANGKSPLGFLNPWLYKTGKNGFRDIARGHNNVCGSKAAFPAKAGWDAATGFGVPDFGKLKSLV